ncbi:MAG: hypothetical protein JRD89_19025, partial [Deltaproteobacteria bacterium]|nr:hypothetical protein [Deltaproteobacteria bacterium]
MAKKNEKMQERLKNLNDLIDEMVRRATAHHKLWKPVYEDGLNYVFNNQLVGQDAREGWDRIVTNQIFPAIMQESALLAQQFPKLITLPWEQGDQAGADVWRDILQWQFEKGLRIPAHRLAAILDGKVFGHWVTKVYWEPKHEWDEEKKRWKGATQITLLRPDYFGMDPEAEDGDLHKAEYCYCHRRVSVAWLIQKWPAFKEEIELAAESSEEEVDPLGGLALEVTAVSSKAALEGSTVSGERGKGVAQTPRVEGRLASLLLG